MFDLLPDKALLWKQHACLIIADLHLGKITHFRKNGIPLPPEIEKDNYDRLATLILNNDIKSVLILGDLFHSDYNSQWPKFKKFLKRFSSISFELVLGNHDILHESAYKAENLLLHKNFLTRDPFHFTHEPCKVEKYNIAGHIHPAVKLRGLGKQSLRLPCFYFNKFGGLLPAFGSFTGMHCIDVKNGDEVYIITENKVVKAS